MKWILGILVTGAVALGAAFYAGLYDISATDQHLAPTYWALDTGMRQAVKLRARNIRVPDLDAPALAARGASLYRAHCQLCHGAPGVAPAPFALGMTPAPVPLVHTARTWSPAEIFWVVKEGIKMTGMPAWRYRMTDDEIWAIVAFLPVMARTSPSDYAALPATPLHETADAFTGEPSAERGRRALDQYVCVTCHEIPGVVGANAPVGPPLRGMGTRVMLGGVLPNSQENLARWIRHPQRYAPGSAMPDLGVSERDAADMAAFLRTLR